MVISKHARIAIFSQSLRHQRTITLCCALQKHLECACYTFTHACIAPLYLCGRVSLVAALAVSSSTYFIWYISKKHLSCAARTVVLERYTASASQNSEIILSFFSSTFAVCCWRFSVECGWDYCRVWCQRSVGGRQMYTVGPQ